MHSSINSKLGFCLSAAKTEMDKTLQLHIISESYIKPSSPTPPSLRCYNISAIDQKNPYEYGRTAFFYPNILGTDLEQREASTIEAASQLLLNALSKTLTYYYPFAGRLKDNLSIICNDMGVLLIEAQVKTPLSEVLKDSYSYMKNLTFPESFSSDSMLVDGCLMRIQLNYFECGGIVVSVSITHRVVDAASLCTFMDDWAAMARQKIYFPSPQFSGASLFPPVQDPPPFLELNTREKENCVTKRFLFTAEKIAELKATAADLGVDSPTRVEVVTALLYRCAMFAARNRLGSFRPSMMSVISNFRQMIQPPLPQNSVGNFITSFSIFVTKQGEGEKLADLVHQLRSSKLRLHSGCKEKFGIHKILSGEISGRTMLQEMRKTDMEWYFCSSLYRLPLYDVDFGWGKPSLVCHGLTEWGRNKFYLVDSAKGDGMEAIVTLNAEDMAVFGCNSELLAFASLITSDS